MTDTIEPTERQQQHLEILADISMYVDFEEFVDDNDIGVPLAILMRQKCAIPTEKGLKLAEQSYKTLCEILDIPVDVYATIDDMQALAEGMEPAPNDEPQHHQPLQKVGEHGATDAPDLTDHQQRHIEILADVYMEYSDEFDEFLDYADLGVPLAVLVSQKCAVPTGKGLGCVEEAYETLCARLALPVDGDYADIDDMLEMSDAF